MRCLVLLCSASNFISVTLGEELNSHKNHIRFCFPLFRGYDETDEPNTNEYTIQRLFLDTFYARRI